MSPQYTILPGMEPYPQDNNNSHSPIKEEQHVSQYSTDSAAETAPVRPCRSPYTRPRPIGQAGALPAQPPMPTPGSASPAHTPANVEESRTARKLIGFLYSVSRTADAEYWALHLGENLIGSAKDCPVRLEEGSVAAHHANLLITQMPQNGGLKATLSQLSDETGDGSELHVLRSEECFNNDIIAIGDNYELLLVLIDAASMGLHPATTFLDMREADAEEENPSESKSAVSQSPLPSMAQVPTPPPLPPKFKGNSPYNRKRPMENPTVIVNPNDSDLHPSATDRATRPGK